MNISIKWFWYFSLIGFNGNAQFFGYDPMHVRWQMRSDALVADFEHVSRIRHIETRGRIWRERTLITERVRLSRRPHTQVLTWEFCGDLGRIQSRSQWRETGNILASRRCNACPYTALSMIVSYRVAGQSSSDLLDSRSDRDSIEIRLTRFDCRYYFVRSARWLTFLIDDLFIDRLQSLEKHCESPPKPWHSSTRVKDENWLVIIATSATKPSSPIALIIALSRIVRRCRGRSLNRWVYRVFGNSIDKFSDCRGHHKNHFLQMNLGSETCHYIATAYGVFERVGTSKYHKK